MTNIDVGIPPELIDKVFEPFLTTKPIGQGTGLGLSMIYRFAQQSGATVTIKSEPGKGTEITLYLPAADDASHLPGLRHRAQMLKAKARRFW